MACRGETSFFSRPKTLTPERPVPSSRGLEAGAGGGAAGGGGGSAGPGAFALAAPGGLLRPRLWFMRLFVRLNAHPGGILVLHDTPALSDRTAQTLRRVVPDLRRLGYRFVSLTELLDSAD